MLIWIDLETTGLDAHVHAPIEIGIIVTDDRLVERARFHSYIAPADSTPWNPWCIEQHTKSGLFARVMETARKHDIRPSLVLCHLLTFLDAHVGSSPADVKTNFLAGSGIHFDRRFLDVHLPQVMTRVSYRMLDVSTLKILGGLWAPEQPFPKTEKAHTTIADLEHSLREFAFWRDLMFKPGFGP